MFGAGIVKILRSNDRLRQRVQRYAGYSIIAFVSCTLLYLVGAAIAENWKSASWLGNAIRVLSVALFPSIIVGLIDHGYTMERATAETAERLEMLFARHSQGREEFGLVAVHNSMDYIGMFQSLRGGDRLLWLDTYCPSHGSFLRHMIDALERGAQIDMLVINTECDNARHRSHEIVGSSYTEDFFIQDVTLFRERVLVETRRVGVQCFRMIQYDDLPCAPMYIIYRSNTLSSGFSSMFLTEPTAYFIHLEWSHVPGGMLQYMESYVRNKLDRALTNEANLLHPTK